MASQARHALRIYSRERCHLPGRLMARLYDGLRHMQAFGTWSSDGMNWDEVKEKYAKEAIRKIGPGASERDIELFIYQRVVDRACATNSIFDEISASKSNFDFEAVTALAKSVFDVEKIRSSSMDLYGQLYRAELSLFKLSKKWEMVMTKGLREGGRNLPISKRCRSRVTIGPHIEDQKSVEKVSKSSSSSSSLPVQRPKMESSSRLMQSMHMKLRCRC